MSNLVFECAASARLTGICLALPCVVLIGGCPGTITPPDDPPGAVTSEVEPNGSFDQADAAEFDDAGSVRLEGSVSRIGDIDVFAIGARLRGDRIVADARTPGSLLDVSIAVFDAEGRLAAENDDSGRPNELFLDSFVDLVVRHDGAVYYLVISHSAFAGNQQIIGRYQVDVRVSQGADVPAPRNQVLYLDFDGGSVNSPSLGSFQLDPFEAGEISTAYDGQTQLIKDQITAVFAQNFERFDVTIATSDGPQPPDPVSVIFFGGFDPHAFGLAENVDLYNIDLCDDAIIYTNSFDPDFFDDFPTAQEMGIAIGNVGSHEAGHLLGLNHTDDDTDLMDDRSRASAFLFDQEFKEAPLSEDIIPIGTQDGMLLLSETVGLVDGLLVTNPASPRLLQPVRWQSEGRPNAASGDPASMKITIRRFLKEVRSPRD